MAEGIRRVGDRADLIESHRYREPDHDVAVFYGFQEMLRKAMADYVRAGKHAVHIDLGYWCRRWNGNRYGFHRFSIDSHHPVAYFQKVRHPKDRADTVGVRLESWRNNGRYILLCGMSEKAAGVVGLGFEEYERDAVNQIRSVTSRPIMYRPKPNKQGNYRALPGTQLMAPGYSDIFSPLAGAHAVVSHHSNAGIDAIVFGVPCFQLDGVALPMGLSDLCQIEKPKVPDQAERRQWANDVAYTQFNCEEMRDGVPWRHFKDEGLI